MPFVNTDDAQIYYETHGEGSPVVLAHGAGAQDQIFPLAALEEVSKIIPGAQLHAVAEACHYPYFEQPTSSTKS